MMANRPSGGSFSVKMKGPAPRPFAVMAILFGVAACSVSVRPTAERIADRLDVRGDAGLDEFLMRRGFSPWTFHPSHPDSGNRSCVEKANGTAMLWVGGVDVVRVCRDLTSGEIGVLHFQTHGIGSVLHTYDPQTGRVVCEDLTDIVKRCPE